MTVAVVYTFVGSRVNYCDIDTSEEATENLPAILTWVTGQLADTPTSGLPTRGLDNSRTGHLAD